MEMSIWLTVSIIILLALMGTGVPIFAAFALVGGISMLFYLGLPFESVAHMFFSSVDKLTLLSIPFFILAGSIMNIGGISKRLINITNAFIGHFPGGMALSAILATTIFGSLSGSNAATAVAIGTMMIPQMVELGYERRFCGAMICGSTSIGILIPPSVAAIIFGYATEMPVGKLFMAGILPGLLLAGLSAVLAIWISRRRNYPKSPRSTWDVRGKALLKGIPALLMPVLILGGIYGGFFTVTEAAAVGVIYALSVSFFVYRELTWNNLWSGFIQAVSTTANIYFLIASAMIIGKVLVILRVPQALTHAVMASGLNSLSFSFLALLLILILGTFLEAAVMILVTMPIFMPVISALGTDPFMFYAMMTIMIGVGQITPPVGILLYIMSDVSVEPVESLFRESFIWLIALVVTAVIVVLFPCLSSWLPGTMHG